MIRNSRGRSYRSGGLKDKGGLSLQVTGNTFVEKPCAVKFSFKNPLKKVLTACQFQYAGPGLAKNTTIPYRYIRTEWTVLYGYHSVIELALRALADPLTKILRNESVK